MSDNRGETRHVGEIIANLQHKMTRRLPPDHIPGSTLKPWTPEEGDPDCEACQGIGWVRNQAAKPGDPEFGKLQVCAACRPDYAKEIAARAYRRNVATIDRYAIQPRPDATFETFETDGRDRSIRAGKIASRRFATQQTDNPWLILYGPVGTGKTHLAMAAVNHIRQQRIPVLFASAPDFFDLMRPGKKPLAAEEALQIAKDVPVLIIDDIGTNKRTEWTTETLYKIVDNRYRTLAPTMFTFNIDLHDLEPRIRSRLLDIQTTIVKMKDTDFRLKRRRA